MVQGTTTNLGHVWDVSLNSWETYFSGGIRSFKQYYGRGDEQNIMKLSG